MKLEHIILTTQNFPPEIGGIQTWCVQLTKEFANKGIPVTVITKSFDDFESEIFEYNNVEVVRLPHKKWRNTKNLSTYKALGKHIRKGTIALAANWKMGVPLYLYNFLHNLPYFTVCHGLDAYEYRKKNRKLQQATFRNSEISIAVSKYTKDYMREKGTESEITVINNGVEDSKYFVMEVPSSIVNKYSFDKSKLNLLNIGRLTPRKGYDNTIKAIADLDDIHFHIGGEGDHINELKQLVKDLSLENKVHFHGYVEEAEMNYLFNLADVFVMPSRNVNDSVEGFGITYLEAAAAGTPSIGSYNTGAEDAIENAKSGLLVDGESIESIRDGIQFFKENPIKIKEFGDYARNRADKFKWSNIAEQYIKLFEEKIADI